MSENLRNASYPKSKIFLKERISACSKVVSSRRLVISSLLGCMAPIGSGGRGIFRHTDQSRSSFAQVLSPGRGITGHGHIWGKGGIDIRNRSASTGALSIFVTPEQAAFLDASSQYADFFTRSTASCFYRLGCLFVSIAALLTVGAMFVSWLHVNVAENTSVPRAPEISTLAGPSRYADCVVGATIRAIGSCWASPLLEIRSVDWRARGMDSARPAALAFLLIGGLAVFANTLTLLLLPTRFCGVDAQSDLWGVRLATVNAVRAGAAAVALAATTAALNASLTRALASLGACDAAKCVTGYGGGVPLASIAVALLALAAMAYTAAALMVREAAAASGVPPIEPSLGAVPPETLLQQNAMRTAQNLYKSQQLDYLLVSSLALEKSEGAYIAPGSKALAYPGDAPLGLAMAEVGGGGACDLFSLALVRWQRVPARASAPPEHFIVPMVVVRGTEPVAKIFLTVEPGLTSLALAEHGGLAGTKTTEMVSPLQIAAAATGGRSYEDFALVMGGARAPSTSVRLSMPVTSPFSNTSGGDSRASPASLRTQHIIPLTNAFSSNTSGESGSGATSGATSTPPPSFDASSTLFAWKDRENRENRTKGSGNSPPGASDVAAVSISPWQAY